MRSTATTVIASVALVLSGCVMGWLVARWSATPPIADHVSAESATQSADITPALIDIRRAIEGLYPALHAGASTPLSTSSSADLVAPAREPIASDAHGLDRLTSAVERLTELLQNGAGSGESRGSASVGSETWRGPGFPSLAMLHQRLEAMRQDDVKAWIQSGGIELSRVHILWSRENVLDRYGTPSRTQASGQTHEVWLFYDGPLLPQGHRWSAVFDTVEGLVASCVLQYR